VDYEYTYAIETSYMVNIRSQPSQNADVVTQVGAGERMMAAQPIAGEDYYDNDFGSGSNWWPVLYKWSGGPELHGFLAEGAARVV
jgi:uncharacterized protein YgiM (DUF1202 family)